ncbi:MAG: hypothetical protein GF311_21445 [Candidatus Lokiarchaeota archaeon]|nr:hypothetical protein [Candidatus Lokiarchaeota archaeon]
MSKVKQHIIDLSFLNEAFRCRECGGVITKTRGDYVCKECGLVKSQKSLDIANKPRRMYTQEAWERLEKNCPRYGFFGNRTNVGHGKYYNENIRNRYLYRRISRLNKRLFTSYTRSLYYAKRDFFNVFSHLRIPGLIRSRAWKLYRDFAKEGFLRGYNRTFTFAATVYIACRENHYPIFAHEIADYFEVKKTKLNHCLYKIFAEFNITMPPMEIRKYILRACSHFNILYKSKMVEEMLGSVNNNRAYDPRGNIAAIVYLLSNETVAQIALTEYLDITEATLRNRKREIIKNLKMKKIERGIAK